MYRDAVGSLSTVEASDFRTASLSHVFFFGMTISSTEPAFGTVAFWPKAEVTEEFLARLNNLINLSCCHIFIQHDQPTGDHCFSQCPGFALISV
uniref:Uncharacterized protein n=1 Tax=Anguilla anguilla TaxID=7936 RepID=A0A0E9R4N1_ANGAN